MFYWYHNVVNVPISKVLDVDLVIIQEMIDEAGVRGGVAHKHTHRRVHVLSPQLLV